MTKLPAILAVAATAVLSSLSAQGALIQRDETMLSADTCQAQTSADEPKLRKRPMGLFNEGTTIAHVTCSFGAAPFGVARTNTVTVGLKNTTTVAKRVVCTVVNGHLDMKTYDLYTKKPTVQPGSLTLVIWNNKVFTYPAVTCALPPGTGIGVTNHTFREEIGS